jgi:hypothetical protein
MAGVVSHLPVAKVQLLRHAASPSGSPPSTSSAFSGQRISKSMTVPAPHRHRGTCVCAQKDEKPKDKEKQGFLSGVAEALDFAAVRSEKDRDLIDEARAQVRSGERMSREQYGALRRKIGGTYKDFFKDSVDVKGKYVEDGWVDKTCYICKKDTSGEPRQKDSWGRYAHVECAANKKQGGFFSKLFGK